MAMLFLKIVWIIVALTYVTDTQKSIWLIDEVRESNVRIINITFDDEIISEMLQCLPV